MYHKIASELFCIGSCDEYSWQRARDLLVQVATHGENTGYEVPCLIVAAKDDLDQSSQALQESTRVSLLAFTCVGIVEPYQDEFPIKFNHTLLL